MTKETKETKKKKISDKELFDIVLDISKLNADKIDCLLKIVENVISHATTTNDERLGFIIEDGLKEYDTISKDGEKIIKVYKTIVESL